MDRTAGFQGRRILQGRALQRTAVERFGTSSAHCDVAQRVSIDPGELAELVKCQHVCHEDI